MFESPLLDIYLNLTFATSVIADMTTTTTNIIPVKAENVEPANETTVPITKLLKNKGKMLTSCVLSVFVIFTVRTAMSTTYSAKSKREICI